MCQKLDCPKTGEHDAHARDMVARLTLSRGLTGTPSVLLNGMEIVHLIVSDGLTIEPNPDELGRYRAKIIFADVDVQMVPTDGDGR